MIPKRERNRMERRLAATLTDACESAKPWLSGFSWLTHEVDYRHFPESLRVTWIFLDDASLAAARDGSARDTILALTATALDGAGVAIDDLSRHVELDSEAACRRQHQGDWQRRLREQSVRH